MGELDKRRQSIAELRERVELASEGGISLATAEDGSVAETSVVEEESVVEDESSVAESEADESSAAEV